MCTLAKSHFCGFRNVFDGKDSGSQRSLDFYSLFPCDGGFFLRLSIILEKKIPKASTSSFHNLFMRLTKTVKFDFFPLDLCDFCVKHILKEETYFYFYKFTHIIDTVFFPIYVQIYVVFN